MENFAGFFDSTTKIIRAQEANVPYYYVIRAWYQRKTFSEHISGQVLREPFCKTDSCVTCFCCNAAFGLGALWLGTMTKARGNCFYFLSPTE